MISIPAISFLAFYIEIVTLFSFHSEDFLLGGNDDLTGFS